MTAPEVQSRWVHKGCRRVCVVVKVTADGDRQFVEFLYERTAGTGDLMTTNRGKRPPQMMRLEQWAGLFTTMAA